MRSTLDESTTTTEKGRSKTLQAYRRQTKGVSAFLLSKIVHILSDVW